jgi:hypothetical protein
MSFRPTVTFFRSESLIIASDECCDPEEVYLLRRCIGLASIIKFKISREMI